MSNMPEIEISKLDDGTFNLSYWDWQSADDVVLIVHPNGNIYRRQWETDDLDDDKATFEALTIYDALQLIWGVANKDG